MLGKISPKIGAQTPTIRITSSLLNPVFSAPTAGNINYGNRCNVRFTMQLPTLQPVVSNVPVTYTLTYTPSTGNTAVQTINFTGSQSATPPATSTFTNLWNSGLNWSTDAHFFRNPGALQIAGQTCGSFTIRATMSVINPGTGLPQTYTSNIVNGTVSFAAGQQQAQTQAQNQSQSQNQNQTGSQQTFQQQWQQQQLGTRIQGRGLTTTLSTRFNPKTGIVEVTKNGVISHRGFLNFQVKNLNRRQALRNYRFR